MFAGVSVKAVRNATGEEDPTKAIFPTGLTKQHRACYNRLVKKKRRLK